ncbi:MAG: HlyD family efflux transporter periplasmic adaptor subunit [Hungatella sp.]
MTGKKSKTIIRYRKPRNFNIGMIMFAIIFIYMFFSVSTYIRKEKVQFYEVTEGSIVNDRRYTGIILRTEKTEYADRAGYVNYYIREGKRASVGTNIYSIDETGTLATVLSDTSEETVNLTEENLMEIKKQLSAFSINYQDCKFSALYDVKYSLEAAVLEYTNFNALDQLDQAADTLGTNFTRVHAPQAGVVSYAIDSYETLTPEQVSADVFDRASYKKAITKSGQLVEKNTPIYKIVTDDFWSVIFPINEQDVSDFSSATSLKVNFSGQKLTSNGTFSLITGSDGKPYGKLDFTKYMVQFVSDRYLDFEIISDKIEGLKIPISSVTTKNFYLIPLDYLAQGGDSLADGFYKEVYTDTGTSIVFVPTTLYNSTDENYYIDIGADSQLKAGDYVVKPNSSERYQIGTTASLEGVYNINKGYTVFKQIAILSQNDEYYTIQKNMKYGLNVYDHIALDDLSIVEKGVMF